MSITLGKTPARLLLSMNVCATKEAAAAKVSAFREWYEEQPEEIQNKLDSMRKRLLSAEINNFGELGADELLASVILAVAGNRGKEE